MLQRISYSGILLVLACSIFGQTISIQHSPQLREAIPESVGMSSERLSRIDEMCKEAIYNEDLPGIVALVARKGKIVFYESYGIANEEKDKLAKDAIFRIASQSKAITSTAVMMLWEQGLFRLDDPISKYIPAFENAEVLNTFRYRDTIYTSKPANKEITIRHLLTHTSGLGYGVIDGDERFKMIYEKAGVTDLYTTENISIEESVKKLAKLPLHHNPGEGFTYSEGLDVLGYFIEVISGVPFDEFLRTSIFDPLGMNDTWFYLPDEKADRLVEVMHRKENAWKKFPVTFYDTDYPVKGSKRFFSGGAGLSSTAYDYATFLQMYLNGGELYGTRILSRTTVKAIMSNQFDELSAWEDKSRYHGLAFGVINDVGQGKGGNGSKGTFEWGGYFNTQYFGDPQEQIIGILMKQTQGPVNDQTGWKFKQLVGQAVDD